MPRLEQYQVGVSGPLPTGSPERNIIFHGVNKSGSLAMSEVLRSSYYASGRANRFFSSYHSLPSNTEAIINIAHASEPNGTLFVSHYLYGAVDLARAQAIMVSQFRHPLPRVLSVHEWLRKHHVATQGADKPFASLEEFVSKSKGISHSQIAQFSVGYGPGWQERLKSTTAEEMRDLSIAALESGVHWFGLAEYFEESIFAMASMCGLSAVPPWSRDDRNTGRKMSWDVSQETRDLISFHFKEEFEFYNFAKALFLSRISTLNFGGDFRQYCVDCNSEYKDRLEVPAQTVPVTAG
jgi:hypothetical protein